LPDLSFFPYCAELLLKYKDDTRVARISGTLSHLNRPSDSSSYFFSQCGGIWGWASWARAWRAYDVEMRGWDSRNVFWLCRHLRSGSIALYWENVFNRTFAGEVDTWDYQWTFTVWNQDWLSLLPRTNLVENIGFDERATHTTEQHGECLPVESMPFPLSHPPSDISTCPNKDREMLFQKFSIEKKTVATLVILYFRKIRKLLLKTAGVGADQRVGRKLMLKAYLRGTLQLVSPRAREYFYRKEHEVGVAAHFDRVQCIYIHIPKCAGVSVTDQLYGCETGHRTASSIQEDYPYSFRKYFKFSVTRDPVARFVSAFQFLKAGGMHAVDQAIAEAHLCAYETADELALAMGDPVVAHRILELLHFQPQVDYVMDAQGHLLVDQLIPLEEFKRGLDIVSARLGIPLTNLKLNQSRTSNQSPVLSAAAVDQLRAVYAADVVLHDASLRQIRAITTVREVY